jgi:hypothetical protein
MRNLRQAMFLAGGAVLLLAPLVFAQATDAEFKCEAAADKAAAKFVGAKWKCIQKCFASAWKGIGLFSDCYAPYAGSTAECIDTVLDQKGAESKYSDAIRQACDPTFKAGTDCPECYAGGDCSSGGYASDQVASMEGQVDSFVPGVMCEGAGADKLEQKCETSTAKALAKQVGAVTKCYDKCFSNARKGLINVATCTPPASDPVTAACVSNAETKAIVGIDKACGPECFFGNNTCGSNSGTCSNDATVRCGCDGDCGSVARRPDCAMIDDSYLSGSGWANLVEVMIDGNIPNTYCE